MENLTIGEVAQISGLRPSAIRYYESLSLLPTPHRISGQRRYDQHVIERLHFIQTARHLGFSLAEIQTLLQDQEASLPLRERWRILARQKLAETQIRIQKAQNVLQLLEKSLDCSCLDLQDCIDCVLANCQG